MAIAGPVGKWPEFQLLLVLCGDDKKMFCKFKYAGSCSFLFLLSTKPVELKSDLCPNLMPQR